MVELMALQSVKRLLKKRDLEMEPTKDYKLA